MNSLLPAFLYFDLFIAGVLLTVAVRHAYAHFRPERHEPERHAAPAAVQLSPAMRERLTTAAEARFQKVLDHAVDQLQHELGASNTKISQQLDKLAGEITSQELLRYRNQLEQLRQEAVGQLSGATAELDQHQAELKAAQEARVASETEQRLAAIDGKLADAVGSFLLETLSHNVDLGAQSAYLTSMLEEHKAELIKELKT